MSSNVLNNDVHMKQLAAFFAAILLDERIGCSHISLYMAVWLTWVESGGQEPVRVDRVTLMRRAKVRGRGTYNKGMREFGEWGYFTYEPSRDARKGGRVWVGE